MKEKHNKKPATPQEFTDNFAKKAFGRSRTDSKKQNICVVCNASCKPEDFKDDLSAQEYQITGFCQKCQDEVFDDPQNGTLEEDPD